MVNIELFTQMKKQNITQRELAKAVGISVTSLHHILNNGSIPKTGTALRIAKVLKCRVDELFKEGV